MKALIGIGMVVACVLFAGRMLYLDWRWLRSPAGRRWWLRVRAVYREIWSRDDREDGPM